ncbi:electron transfer flavoprotein [Escherichia marmotae]|nr:electron transfer flavoprotein [Escherichia marmotae]
MKIITCFKLVPEEQDIVVTPEYTLNFDNADAKISQFDLNAIEAASQLATDDDEIAALTVGGSLLQNSKVRKDVLSRGPHSLYLVQDAQLEHALALDRALEDDVEVIELSVPAVLCVTSDINVPRIPSMKAILGAGKKPVNQWQASDIDWSQSAPLAELVGIRVPPQTERKHIIIDNDSPEAIAELAEHLKKALN